MAKFEMGAELKEQIAKADGLKKDISTARGIINNAMKQYIKRKIGARNKKQVEDQAAYFAELDGYESKEQIRDDYGWELITESQMDRLMDMWDAREIAQKNAGNYSDRVTEMLMIAMDAVSNAYAGEIYDAEQAKRRFDEDVKRIQSENAERDWQRRHGRIL